MTSVIKFRLKFSNLNFLMIINSLPKFYYFINIVYRINRRKTTLFGLFSEEMLRVNQKMLGEVAGRKSRKNFTSKSKLIKLGEATNVVNMTMGYKYRFYCFWVVRKWFKI